MQSVTTVTLAVVAFVLLSASSGRALISNVQRLQKLRRIDVSSARVPCWAPRSGGPPDGLDREAIAANPALAPFFRGCLAYARGKASEAVAEWRAAGAEPFFLVDGFSYAKRGEYRWALGQYQIAVLMNPRSADAWAGVTAAQMNLATVAQLPWTDMLESAERLVALTPDDPQAHYLLGYALWLSRRDPRDAERELRWALDRRRGEAEAYALGRMLNDEARPSEAIPLLEYAAPRMDNAEVLAVLMQAYRAARRCHDGDVVFRAVLAKEPGQLARLRKACELSPGCPCG